MSKITVYRNGKFEREEAPPSIVKAEAAAEVNGDYCKAMERCLGARRIRLDAGWEFNNLGGADIYELGDGSGYLVEITMGEDLLETVYIPGREELLPFVVNYALPICRGQGQLEILACLNRIANLLGTMAEEHFNIEIDEFSGNSRRKLANQLRQRQRCGTRQ